MYSDKDESKTFFLGVGAAKSGTSWMYNYFKSHPEILMSPIKEMNFFGNRKNSQLTRFKEMLALKDVEAAFTGRTYRYSRKILNERITMAGDIAKYKTFFHNLITDEKAYGEITPAYAFMPKEEFEDIRDHFPDCKIIFLMRNPVDRIWSQMRFRQTDKTPSELRARALDLLTSKMYTKRGNYRQTIQNLTAVFPSQNIHFEFFEHFFTHRAINRLCGFLKVSYHAANLDTKVNESFKVELPLELRQKMVCALKPQYIFAKSFFGDDLPESWTDDFQYIS